MIDMGKLIEDVSKLTEIPIINKILYHRVEEIKALYNRKIKEYDALIRMVNLEKGPLPVESRVFDITRKEVDKKWESSIELPTKVIDFLADYDISPGVLVVLKEVKFDGVGSFDLIFEKGENSIAGTIFNLHKVKTDNEDALVKKSDPLPEYEIEKISKEDFLKIFIFYFLGFPLYSTHVMQEFFKIWKPYLTSKIDIPGKLESKNSKNN